MKSPKQYSIAVAAISTVALVLVVVSVVAFLQITDLANRSRAQVELKPFQAARTTDELTTSCIEATRTTGVVEMSFHWNPGMPTDFQLAHRFLMGVQADGRLAIIAILPPSEHAKHENELDYAIWADGNGIEIADGVSSAYIRLDHFRVPETGVQLLTHRVLSAANAVHVLVQNKPASSDVPTTAYLSREDGSRLLRAIYGDHSSNARFDEVWLRYSQAGNDLLKIEVGQGRHVIISADYRELSPVALDEDLSRYEWVCKSDAANNHSPRPRLDGLMDFLSDNGIGEVHSGYRYPPAAPSSQNNDIEVGNASTSSLNENVTFRYKGAYVTLTIATHSPDAFWKVNTTRAVHGDVSEFGSWYGSTLTNVTYVPALGDWSVGITVTKTAQSNAIAKDIGALALRWLRGSGE